MVWRPFIYNSQGRRFPLTRLLVCHNLRRLYSKIDMGIMAEDDYPCIGMHQNGMHLLMYMSEKKDLFSILLAPRMRMCFVWLAHGRADILDIIDVSSCLTIHIFLGERLNHQWHLTNSISEHPVVLVSICVFSLSISFPITIWYSISSFLERRNHCTRDY